MALCCIVSEYAKYFLQSANFSYYICGAQDTQFETSHNDVDVQESKVDWVTLR